MRYFVKSLIFLALLEMIRTAELVCKQKDIFGQIEMKLSIGAEA